MSMRFSRGNIPFFDIYGILHSPIIDFIKQSKNNHSTSPHHIGSEGSEAGLSPAIVDSIPLGSCSLSHGTQAHRVLYFRHSEPISLPEDISLNITVYILPSHCHYANTTAGHQHRNPLTTTSVSVAGSGIRHSRSRAISIHVCLTSVIV